MTIRLRAFLLSLTIIAVLVFSAVGPSVAYADGETPTEPAPTETAVEPVQTESVTTEEVPPSETAPVEASGDGSAATEDAATEAPAGEGEATPVPEAEAEATEVPVEEAAPATEPVATEAPVEPAPVEVAATEAPPALEAPVLEAVPDNTTVTVLSAEGEVQPLASEAAAEAIATTTDPIWCPAGQSPTPGANGCTQSFTSFTALLQFLEGNASYAGAGTIYVEAGNYQGGESTVDFNNYNLSNISNADLTITGGWNTTTNVIDTANPTIFNNVSLIIGSVGNPWGGTLAINNINIVDPTNTGLILYSNTDIELDNVVATNSANGSGAELNAGQDVIIQNSNFNRNRLMGARVTAGGNVTVVNSNFGNPADARRQSGGLWIDSGGAVTLVNVTANENRRGGVHIDADGFVTIVNSIFSGSKETVGADFLGYGLEIITLDGVALDTVTANDNFLWGASITAGQDVTIANSNFNANTTEDAGFIDDTGLFILSARNVSIDNTHADDNRLYGAQITATGDVAISNSTFNSNNGVTLSNTGTEELHGYGLVVVTAGNISLNGVTAADNTLGGAQLDAGIDATIINSDFSIVAADPTALPVAPGNFGLQVIADGNVFLDGVTVNNNATSGANIQAGGSVFLDGVTATGNGTNGVEVQANCTTVFLINGTYTGNGQYGLSILNGQLNQTGAPVFSGNGAGDIFQDPGTCVFIPTAPPTAPVPPEIPPTAPVENPEQNPAPTPPTEPVVTAGTQQGVNSLARMVRYSTAGSKTIKTAGGLSAENVVTLNSFLASTQTADSTHLGLFTGMYTIVYFSDGSFQIIALTPNALDEMAMAES